MDRRSQKDLEGNGRQAENPLFPTSSWETSRRPYRYDRSGDFHEVPQPTGRPDHRHHVGSEVQKPLRHQMPERDHRNPTPKTFGKRMGPLQICHPRTVAGDLSSHPHAAEGQSRLSGPGILSPDRRSLHRRNPSRLR